MFSCQIRTHIFKHVTPTIRPLQKLQQKQKVIKRPVEIIKKIKFDKERTSAKSNRQTAPLPERPKEVTDGPYGKDTG